VLAVRCARLVREYRPGPEQEGAVRSRELACRRGHRSTESDPAGRQTQHHNARVPRRLQPTAAVYDPRVEAGCRAASFALRPRAGLDGAFGADHAATPGSEGWLSK